MRASSVWGRLGTLLIREGADPTVLKIFYRKVIKSVLLFGDETWVISAAMEQEIEGTYTDFLHNIMKKQARRFP